VHLSEIGVSGEDPAIEDFFPAPPPFDEGGRIVRLEGACFGLVAVSEDEIGNEPAYEDFGFFLIPQGFSPIERGLEDFDERRIAFLRASARPS
jgi:hypothetical protein